MEAFFLEIYNEKIRDLLKNKKRGGSSNQSSTAKKEKKVSKEDKYEIKHDTKGVTTVTNLTVGMYSFFKNQLPKPNTF